MKKEMPLKLQLFFFTIAISLITYAFNLTNFALSIDSEPIVSKNSYLELGRWGTNFIRYYVFDGAVIPYFTVFISLVMFSASAVLMTDILRLRRLESILFCALFVSFPQIAYQFIYYLQADAVSLGFLLSAVFILLFVKIIEGSNKLVSAGLFLLAALIMMFVISIYQALIFVPAVLYLVLVFRNTYLEGYTLTAEFKKALLFGLLLLVSAGFYYISQKILCPDVSQYLSSYANGASGNRFVNFYNIWIENLWGDRFYGDKTFLVASLSAICTLIFLFRKERKMFFTRAVLIVLMLIAPFFISLFITIGYHPARLYLASGIVYAYLIAQFFASVKYRDLAVGFAGVIVLMNIYFITKLYVAHHGVQNHDLQLASKIDNKIREVYPEFEPRRDYVYFYGAVPDSDFNRIKIPESDVFGGSFFQWDTGSNGRIISYMRAVDVANYKIIDSKDLFLKIRDSISDMPVWPKPGSVKQVNDVMIVKLGNVKGHALWVEEE